MNIVAFTGAGISKASGIPTFEEVPGIRRYLSRDYFNQNPEQFYLKLIGMHKQIREAEPNAGHRALVKYDVPVITMNIDGLHQKAGSRRVVEMHGNLTHVNCPQCQKKYSFHTVAKSIYCVDCQQLLEHEVILYGDLIPKFPEAFELVGTADLLLVIGTSFFTSTANVIVDYAQRNAVDVHVINERAEVEVEPFLAKYI